MLFSEYLRNLRKNSGIKQRDIARAIGVDVPMYSRYEHGERRPKREQVLKLARLLNADADELVALWLAECAVNAIGNDKMVGRALTYMAQTLGVEAPASQPVQSADAAAPTVNTEIHDNNLSEKKETPNNELTDAKVDDDTFDYSHCHLIANLSQSLRPNFICADALSTLQQIESDSIDCVVTTPPYWSLQRHNTDGIDNLTLTEYVDGILATMRQIKRVLKPQGSLWLNMGDAYQNKSLLGLPWRIANRMVDEQNWLLRNDVVWNKIQSAFDSSTDRLRTVHEFMFHFVKGNEFYYNDELLRQNASRTVEARSTKVKGKTNSGVTGAKYEQKIHESRYLTDEEKNNALQRLNEVVALVNSGDIPDFRMFLREESVDATSRSEKARAIREDGFYFLLYNANGTMPGDVWEISPVQSEIKRYNISPDDLCRIPIMATCPAEGIVLDPFCGTGTTCRIAQELKCRSIGIDINQSYIDMANARLRTVTMSLF